MESYIKSPNTKRFVVEDSITKVTSDGEPHGMMTMVAILSGLLAAIVILAILVSLVVRRKTNTQHTNIEVRNIETVSGDSQSYNNNKAKTVTMTLPNSKSKSKSFVDDRRSRLGGNLNASFISSGELCFNDDTLHGKYKQNDWQASVAAEAQQMRETVIQVERY